MPTPMPSHAPGIAQLHAPRESQLHPPREPRPHTPREHRPAWPEDRRVVELLDRIESTALTVREKRRPAVVMEIDASVPDIVLPFERPLYRVPTNRVRASAAVDDTRRTDASGRSTR